MARRARDRSTAPGLDSLLASKEMIVVCGSGGTGKTTVSAALGAMAATRLGARVLVLTVDPARRLATALGLGSQGLGGGEAGGRAGTEVQVDPALLRAADPNAAASGPNVRQGELWVAMLDTKAGWDDLIRRHAPDATLRDQVLANPLYQNITGRFVHSHDYLAMERLHELHASGRFDLVIIDTPPSRNALDLLDAPGRMKEFFGSRLLRWLTVPYRSRLFTAGVEAVLPSGRSSARLAIPAGHRRVLRAVPDDGEGLRVPCRRGRAAARRPAHVVRRRVDARGRAGVRGRVLVA